MSRSRQITNLSRALRAPSRTPRAAASINNARIASSPLRTTTQLPGTVKTRTPLAAHQSRSFLTTAPRSQDTPQSISDEQYHEIADNFLESALKAVDEAMEHRDDLDLEFEEHILTVMIEGVGTWVVNKQPPNKQIWWSSPISGPRRYDWVEQADGSGADWVYLRDGGLLRDLIREEWGVEVPRESY